MQENYNVGIYCRFIAFNNGVDTICKNSEMQPIKYLQMIDLLPDRIPVKLAGILAFPVTMDYGSTDTRIRFHCI